MSYNLLHYVSLLQIYRNSTFISYLFVHVYIMLIYQINSINQSTNQWEGTHNSLFVRQYPLLMLGEADHAHVIHVIVGITFCFMERGVVNFATLNMFYDQLRHV